MFILFLELHTQARTHTDRQTGTHTHMHTQDQILPWPVYGLALSFRRLGELLLLVILWKIK